MVLNGLILLILNLFVPIYFFIFTYNVVQCCFRKCGGKSGDGLLEKEFIYLWMLVTGFLFCGVLGERLC